MWLQIQLEKATASFQSVTEDLRRRFAVDGEPLLEEGVEGKSPMLGASFFNRTTGFAVPQKAVISSSGAWTAASQERCAFSPGSSG